MTWRPHRDHRQAETGCSTNHLARPLHHIGCAATASSLTLEVATRRLRTSSATRQASQTLTLAFMSSVTGPALVVHSDSVPRINEDEIKLTSDTARKRGIDGRCCSKVSTPLLTVRRAGHRVGMEILMEMEDDRRGALLPTTRRLLLPDTTEARQAERCVPEAATVDQLISRCLGSATCIASPWLRLYNSNELDKPRSRWYAWSSATRPQPTQDAAEVQALPQHCGSGNNENKVPPAGQLP